MQRNKIIPCLLLCFVGAFTHAQDLGKVWGTVSSPEGQPVFSALVKIEGIAMETTSDRKGYYVIDKLRAGTYTISASLAGCLPVYKSFTIQSGEEVKVDFNLGEQHKALDEVVVVNNAIAEKEKEGFALEAISIKPIQNQSIELNKVLDMTAGIRVRQDGGLGSRVNYMMNGLGGKAVRFFLDGIPMDYFGSSYSVNTIPISMIERVEVYKGVVPVELGNDALGGAINLVTKTRYANSAELSYSYGSFNTHKANVMANYHNKRSGAAARFSAFYNYSNNNYTIWGDDVYVTDPMTFVVQRGIRVKRFHDSFESKAIKADFGFTRKRWADQLFAGLLYSDLDKDIQHGSTMEVPFGKAMYYQKVIMPYLIYQKYDIVKGLDINFFGSYSNLVQSQVDTSRNIYNWYGQVEGTRTLGGERTRTLNVLTENVFLNRINLVYRFDKKHKLGFNYLFSDLTRTDSDAILDQKSEGYWEPQLLQKHSLGLSYQSNLINERLSSSVFIKAFDFGAAIKTSEINQGVTSYGTARTSGSSLGYGVAASYKITPIITLNGSFEKTYRLPEADEILGDGLIVMSTTKLKPESSYNANLGFKLQVFEEKDNKIRFSGNTFYRDVTDLIQQWQYNLGTFVYINFDKVQMRGFDAKVQYLHKTLFTLNQTVSLLDPIVKADKDELGNDNLLQESRLPNTPFFQTNTEAQLNLKNLVQHKSSVFLYWSVSYVGSFYKHSEVIGQFNKDLIPAQLVNSCGAGYTFPKQDFSVSLDVNNLFNEQVFLTILPFKSPDCQLL